MQQATWTRSGPSAAAFDREPLITDPVERARVLRRLELFARLLDDAFHLPGTNIRLGWDGIIGMVPVAGDTLTALLSFYFIWEAKRLGVSKWTLGRMLANLGIDFLAGAVPFVGDLVDFAWKANRRNLELLFRELRQHHGKHDIVARVVR
jgi:hypothetical protein